MPDLEGEKKKVSPSVNFPFLSDPGGQGLEGPVEVKIHSWIVHLVSGCTLELSSFSQNK